MSRLIRWLRRCFEPVPALALVPVRFLRGLNYEPQHVDPWHHESAEVFAVLPRTLPAPVFEPVLSAPRIVGGYQAGLVAVFADVPRTGHSAEDYGSESAWLAAEIADMQAEEDERLLDDQWLHTHWWWYAQERQREADDYHNWVEADRRRWRIENGLTALELAAAA